MPLTAIQESGLCNASEVTSFTQKIKINATEALQYCSGKPTLLMMNVSEYNQYCILTFICETELGSVCSYTKLILSERIG